AEEVAGIVLRGVVEEDRQLSHGFDQIAGGHELELVRGHGRDWSRRGEARGPQPRPRHRDLLDDALLGGNDGGEGHRNGGRASAAIEGFHVSPLRAVRHAQKTVAPVRGLDYRWGVLGAMLRRAERTCATAGRWNW